MYESFESLVDPPKKEVFLKGTFVIFTFFKKGKIFNLKKSKVRENSRWYAGFLHAM